MARPAAVRRVLLGTVGILLQPEYSACQVRMLVCMRPPVPIASERPAAGLAFVALALLLWGCGGPQRQARAPQPGQPHIKVMTYNVNYGLAGDDQSIDAMRDGWADVVFLQETTAEWEIALRRELGTTYPEMAFRHCCGAGGLAVLSKIPFEEKDYLPAQHGWFPAWRLVLDSSLGPVQVLVVHLRPPVSDGGSVLSGYFSTPPIREREIAQFHEALDPALPTLVVGDFNEGDGGRAMVYLERRGLRSALPEFDTPQDTWRWNTSVGTIHTQLDHIVYDGTQLEPLQVKVLPVGRSDHMPVVGVFALPTAGPKLEPSRSADDRSSL